MSYRGRCRPWATCPITQRKCACLDTWRIFGALREAYGRLDSRDLFRFFVKEYVIVGLRKIRFATQCETKTGREVSVTRQEMILAVLAASQGRPYSPVQIQKAAFLVTENLPQLVNEGQNFTFEPYDYGPFDQSVYTECEHLARKGLAEIISQSGVRWNRYAASDVGIERGTEILNSIPKRASDYVKNVSTWVRSQSFESLVRAIYAEYPEMKANSVFRG
jgi:uncharacterized protein